MREHADTSKLDAIEQAIEALEHMQPAAINDIDHGQLEHAQAVCRQVIDNWDLDDAVRMKAATLYARATELKAGVIMTAARHITPRLCQSCGKGRHRVRCLTCPRGEPVTVKLPGHVKNGAAS